MPEHCFDRDALPAPRRLLSHPNYDLVFSEGQHRAGARAFQVHNHAGVVLQPQIAAARRAETGFAGALRVSARKIADADELVDGAGGADFLNPATGAPATGAHDAAEDFERIVLPLAFQGAVTGADARDAILGDRHPARGRQAATLCSLKYSSSRSSRSPQAQPP